ncbi:hypothetical protein DL770_000074 [Monosporascus sp. CRB-9-2]|nr:hypothetical protein DL770_000074 [Monosporascus sp. CRB-9-2]
MYRKDRTNSETQISDGHTQSSPTATDACLDDVTRILPLLQDNTILQRVFDKRRSGEYHFDRYESMQLLNLCFYQAEIRPLEHDIFKCLESQAESQAKDQPEDHPEDQAKDQAKDDDKLRNLADKIRLLRQLLREYSKPECERIF